MNIIFRTFCTVLFAMAVLVSQAVADTVSTVTVSTTTITGSTAGSTGTSTTSASPSFSGAEAVSPPESRLVDQYAGWSGSADNARALISGLRNGSSITLQSDAAAQSSTTSSSTTGSMATAGTSAFSVPTGNMGWGNVSKALSLAQADLAAAGITQPTPQQIQTALTGGEVTVTQGGTVQTVKMDGILTMRSQGMGWGQIAKQLNLHPGSVFKGGASGQSLSTTSGAGKSLNASNVRTDPESGHRSVTAHGTSTVANGSRMESHRVTTAGGTVSHEGHDSGSHGAGSSDHHAERAAYSRVVTAGGGVSGASGHYQHGEAGHLQTVSHVTTATHAGIHVASGAGHAADSGKGHH